MSAQILQPRDRLTLNHQLAVSKPHPIRLISSSATIENFPDVDPIDEESNSLRTNLGTEYLSDDTLQGRFGFILAVGFLLEVEKARHQGCQILLYLFLERLTCYRGN